VHFVVQPCALILLIVGPHVHSFSLDLVHFKMALVNRSIRKSELTRAVLFTFMVLSFVHGIVRPGLQTVTVLLIVTPRTLIPSTVCVGIDALSVSLVIHPVTFINVAIRVVQLSLSVGFSIAPLALISRPVEPLLLAMTVSHAVHPLTVVNSATVELDGVLLDTHVGHAFFDWLIWRISKSSLLASKHSAVHIAVHILIVEGLLLRVLMTSVLIAVDSGGLILIESLLQLITVDLLLLRV